MVSADVSRAWCCTRRILPGDSAGGGRFPARRVPWQVPEGRSPDAGDICGDLEFDEEDCSYIIALCALRETTIIITLIITFN